MSKAELTRYKADFGERAADAMLKAYGGMPLEVMVDAVIRELTKRRREFTAFDVTMYLRSIFPEAQHPLPHYDQGALPGVQAEVHKQMQHFTGTGEYATITVRPNGVDEAKKYVPYACVSNAAPKPYPSSLPLPPTVHPPGAYDPYLNYRTLTPRPQQPLFPPASSPASASDRGPAKVAPTPFRQEIPAGAWVVSQDGVDP